MDLGPTLFPPWLDNYNKIIVFIVICYFMSLW